ncbi:MAG: hypothetical protein ACXAAR_01500 [Candidatus Thorarchaeota archaeon]
MKKKILIAFAMVMMFSLSTCFVLAGKPPKTTLDVTILSPVDGLEVPYDEVLEACGTFEVTGNVQATRGDAGYVQTFVQYAFEGSTDFNDVGDTTLQFVNGDQPQTDTLAKDESYGVIWTLTGIPGTYEMRIFSQGDTAKSGESSSRTVTLLGPPPDPPPDDCETIDAEYQDPETGYGTSSGTFVNTYYTDGEYEILMEERNRQGTKNPKDDTADLGWIYVFDNLGPRFDTTFQFYGHMELSGEYLDSGFLQWDDQDTAFFVQEKSSGSWKTIAAITNIGSDKMYSVDIQDDISETIYLRVVDNDRGPEMKSPQVSSLYVDMACIVYETAFEYIIDDIEFEMPAASDCFRIADIDNDLENEVYITYHLEEGGNVKYYEYTDGVWTLETIADLFVFGWVQVEDVDNDNLNEILTMEVLPNDEFWIGYHKYESGWTYYPIGQWYEVMPTVVVGNIDADPENEIVACKTPCDGFELSYFDYDTASGNWDRINLRNFEYDYSMIEIADIDHDTYNEIVCYARGSVDIVGESALKYFEFDGIWVEHDILSVESGECMTTGDVDNDFETEIAVAQWRYPERENYVKVYDYNDDLHLWEETLNAYQSEALGPVKDLVIGNVDNSDGDNELAIGFLDAGVGRTNDTIRYYEYGPGGWTEHMVTDTDLTVADLFIGDVDNDGEIELLVGLTVSSYGDSVVAPELRYYKVHRKLNS